MNASNKNDRTPRCKDCGRSADAKAHPAPKIRVPIRKTLDGDGVVHTIIAMNQHGGTLYCGRKFMIRKTGMPEEISPLVAQAGYEYMQPRGEVSVTSCVLCLAHEEPAKPSHHSALAQQLLKQMKDEA